MKVSIDGINDVYEYIRQGAKFESVIANLENLQGAGLKNLDISIGFTTQAYNVFQLPEFIEFFEKYVSVDRISTHLLHDPELLTINAIAEPYKSKIINKLENSTFDFGAIIKTLKNEGENSPLWEKLVKYSANLDTRFKTKISFESLMDRYLDGY